MDDFKSLGVSRSASPKEIQRAWRVLVKANHPDRSQDPVAATKALQEINAAYDRIRQGKPILQEHSRADSSHRKASPKNTRPFSWDDFKTFYDAPRDRSRQEPNASRASEETQGATDAKSARNAGASDARSKTESSGHAGSSHKADSSHTKAKSEGSQAKPGTSSDFSAKQEQAQRSKPEADNQASAAKRSTSREDAREYRVMAAAYERSKRLKAQSERSSSGVSIEI